MSATKKETTMSSESIRERIVRLIKEMRNRTTDRGATPAEAAAFASKVAEWVEKYQIDEAELQAKGGTNQAPTEVCENLLRTGKKVFNPGMTQVVNSLALGMCCKVILLHKDGEAVYGITGDELDANYVCQVALTVVPALRIMAAFEGAEHGCEKAGLVRWTNQYLTGAGVEIKRRLEQERKDRSEVKEIENRLVNTGGTALVVVTGESLAILKRAATEEAFRERYPKTRTSYSRTQYDSVANECGRVAGKNIGLHVTIK